MIEQMLARGAVQAERRQHEERILSRRVRHQRNGHVPRTRPRHDLGEPGERLQTIRELPETGFLPLDQRVRLFRVEFGEEVGHDVRIQTAADVRAVEVLVDVPIVIGQLLLPRPHVDGIGVGEGAVEVEQQGFDHAPSVPAPEFVGSPIVCVRRGRLA
jgi:hypothetical protein